MDWTLLILSIIAIAVIALFQFFLRKNRPSANTQAQIVNSLLSDVRVNQRLLEVYMNGEEIKYFCLTGWKINKGRIAFLKKSLVNAINEVALIAENYELARKGKIEPEKGLIDTGKMKELLQRSRSGLEDWLMTMTGTIEPGGKTGFFDFLIGKW